MKKFFTNNLLRPLLLLTTIVVGSVGVLSAQVATNYTFVQSSGTYSPITGGVLYGNTTSDDQRFVDPAVPAGGTVVTGVGLPIGFTFTYNGTAFDRLAINNNGWITFGQSSLGATAVNNTSSSSYTALSATTVGVGSNRIAPFAADLQGQTGSELRLQTIGTAPNRVCVVQWTNYRRFNQTGSNLNFQIRLNECGNTVDLVYGAQTFNTTSSTIQVGIRGTLTTDFLNRTTTTNWNTTTAGGTNAATCTILNTVTVPASGTTFSYIPKCSGTPAAPTASITQATTCTYPIAVTMSVSGCAPPASTGTTFQWESSTDNFTSAGVPISGATNTSIAQSPSAATQYRLKVTCSFSTLFAYSNVVGIANAAAMSAPSIARTTGAASACFGTVPATVGFTGTASGGCPPYTYKLFEVGNATALQTFTGVAAATQVFANLTPAAGTHDYYVEVTDAAGTPVTLTSSNSNVVINAQPTVTVTPSSGTYCSPGAAVALTAAGSGGTGSLTYGWSPAAGLSATTGTTTNASPTSTTNYIVTVTDANTCTGISTVPITVSVGVSISSVTATPATICSGGSSQLVATATLGAAAVVKITEVMFNKGGTGSTASIPAYAAAGADIVEISNISGNPADISGWTVSDYASGTATITHPGFAFPTGTIIPANGVALVCLGSGTDDIANRYFNTGGTNDSWFSSSVWGAVLKSGSTVIDAVGIGTTISFAAGTGVTAADWTGVTAATAGFAGIIRTAASDNNVAADFTVANGTLLQTIGTYNSGYISPSISSYAWSPATYLSSTVIANPIANGVMATTTYTVTATTSAGCTATGTVAVNISASVLTTANITNAGASVGCPGTGFTFGSNLVGGCPNYTYRLYETIAGTPTLLQTKTGISTTSTTFTAVVPATGAHSYYVEITDFNANVATSTPLSVTVYGTPTVTTTVGNNGCYDGITGVQLNETATGNVDWIWSPLAGLSDGFIQNPVASPTASTTYTVLVTDANNCTNTGTIRVDRAVALTPQNISICPNSASLAIGATGTCANNSASITIPINNAAANTTEGIDIASAVNITSFTLPAFPAGTVITGGTLNYNNIALGAGTFGSEIRLILTGAITETVGVQGATTTGTPNPVNYSRVITPATVNIAGGLVNIGYYESFNDAVVPDAVFPAGTGVGSITLNYTFPASIQWYTAASGGSPIATGSTMDPVATAGSGITNTATLATTTFYAACSNSSACRQAVTYTIQNATLGGATISPNVMQVCPTGTFTFTGGITGGCSAYTFRLYEGATLIQTKTGISSVSTAFTPIAPTVGPHSYTVEVTDASGSTATSPVSNVTVNPYPVVTATPPTNCFTATAVGLTAGGASTYAWSPAAGLSATTGTTVNASPAASTTYTVTGTDANTCTATASVQVDKMPFTGANNGIVCQGSTAPLLSAVGTCPNTTGSITLTFPAASITVPDVGASSTIATFTMPALPTGAVATSIVITANNTTTNTGSTIVWQNDLQLGLSGAAVVALSTGAGAASTASQTAPGWNYVSTISSGSLTAAGGVVNLIYSSFNSAGQDHYFPNGVTAVISYSAPAAQDWFTMASGGTSFATGTSVQIVGGTGPLANTNTVATTTVYTACTNSVNCRQPVTLTVNQAYTANAGIDKGTCQAAAPTAIALSDATIAGPTGIQAAWSIVSGGTLGALSSTAMSATPNTVTFTPNASAFGVVTLRLTTNDPDGATGCAAVTDDVVITIYQKPVLVLTTSAACFATGGDLNAFINVAGSTLPDGAATTYNFFLADMVTPVPDPSAAPAAGTYFIQAQNSAAMSSCVSALMSVTLNDGPVFALTAPAAAARPCIGTPISLNRSPILTESPVVGETINYDVEDPINVVTPGVTLAGAPYSITQCPAPSPALGVYTFTGTSSLTGCTSVNQVTITFKQTPTLTIVPPAAVCFPSTVNIATAAVRTSVNAPTAPTSTPTFSYYPTAADAAAGTSPISAGAAAALAAPSNPNNTPYTNTFYIRSQLTNGCRDIEPVSIAINGLPVGVVTAGGNQTVCGSTAPTFTGITFGTSNSVAGTTFAWSRNKTAEVTGLAASGTGNVAAASLVNTTTVAQTVTFTVTPTSASTPACPGAPFTTTVIVNPDVVAPSAVTPFAVCPGGTIAAGQGVSASCGGANITVNFPGPINPSGNGTAGAPLTISTAAFPGIPVGATITSATLVSNGVTVVAGSFASECRLGLSGAITNAAVGSTVATGAPFNYSRALTGLTAPIAAGTLNLLYFDSFPDAAVDETFPNGVQFNISYTLPGTITYYASATGTDLLGSAAAGVGYNPVGVIAAGATTALVPNNTTPGVYTLYAQCPGCGTNRTPVTFTVNTPPTAAITPVSPVEVCVGSSATFTASGGGTYLWSIGAVTTPALTLNFNIVSSGNIFTVTVTGANTCTASATTTVNINAIPAPNITSTGGAVLCLGSSATLDAGVTGVSYLWNTGAVTQTIMDAPTVTTTYTVTVTSTGAGSCTASQSKTIAVSPPINITAISATPASLCGTGTSNLSVTANTTSPVPYTVSGGGGIINASGVSAPFPMSINVSGLPTTGVTVKNVIINGITHTFGSDVDIYLHSPTSQDVILMTDVNGANDFVNNTYTFQDGSPLMTTGLNVDGTYRCSNLTGYSGPAPLPVGTSTSLASFTGNPNGTWNFYVFDDAAGDGGSINSFSIVFNVPNTLSYAWSGGVTTPTLATATTPTITATTTYTVTVTNSFGCTNTGTTTVTVVTPPNAGTGSTATACNSSTTAIDLSTFLTAHDAGGTWVKTSAGAATGFTAAAGTFVPNGNTAGTYTFTYTVTGTSPCPNSTATVAVVLDPALIAPVLANATYCVGATATALDAATTNATTYLWSDAGATATAMFTPSTVTAAVTTYTVTVSATGSTCPAVTASAVITVNAPITAPVLANATYCVGGTATALDATVATATAYLWSDAGATATAMFTPSTATAAVTTYTVTVTAPIGCPTATASATITVNAPLIAPVLTAATYCIGATATALDATTANATAYLWSDAGATATATFTPTTAAAAVTTYTVTVSAPASGCPAVTASAVITVNAPITAPVLASATYCQNASPVTALDATTAGATAYAWTGGTTAATFTPGTATAAVTTYTVTVTAPMGCPNVTASATITVNAAPTQTLAPATQAICSGSAMTQINITPAVTLTTTSMPLIAPPLTPTTAALFNWNGSFFDLTNNGSVPLTIVSIAPLVGVTPTAGGTAAYTLYATTTPGQTQATNNTTAANWTALTAFTVTLPTSGTFSLTNPVTLATPIILAPGESRGFYFASGNAITRVRAYTTAGGTVAQNWAGPTTFTTGSLTYTAGNANTGTTNFASIFAGGNQVLRGNSTSSPNNFIVYTTGTTLAWTRDNTTNITGTGTSAGASGNTFPLNANFVNNTTTSQTTIYTLTATGLNGCTATSTAAVTVNVSATVNPGVSQQICAGSTATLAGSFGGSATTATWTTAGSGTFGSTGTGTSTLLTDVYTPSAADIAAGSAVLTLTSDAPAGGGGCTAAAVPITISISSAPTGTDYTACQGAAAIAGQGLGATGSTCGPAVVGPFVGSLTASDPLWVRPNVVASTGSSTVSATLPTGVANGTAVRYDTYTFIAPLSGSYTFVGNSTGLDGFGVLYSGAFSAAAPLTNAIAGSDDTGGVGAAYNNDPIITATLVGGQSYTYVMTSWDNGGLGNYQIVMTASPSGTLGWYTAATGGAQIGAGATFNPIGAAGSGITTATAPGNYTFYAGCGGAPCRTPIVLTISAAPIANAGVDASVCANATYTLAGAFIGGNATAQTWATSGSGTFDNTAALNAVYTPSAADATAGTVTLTLTATNGVSGACSSASDAMVLTITPIPTVTPYTVCKDAVVPAGQGLGSSCASGVLDAGVATVNFNVTAQPTEISSTNLAFAGPYSAVATATMAALPAGAVVTGATLTYNGIEALTNAWQSDVSLGLQGAAVVAPAISSQFVGNITGNVAGIFNFTRTIPAASIPTAGGAITLNYWDYFNDNAGAEQTFPIGATAATLTINYSLPASPQWFAAATGGAALATGTTFDPTSAGYTTATAGTTTFYAQCGANGCRTPVVFTVNPLPVSGGGVTYADGSGNIPACFSSATNGGNVFNTSFSNECAPSLAAPIAARGPGGQTGGNSNVLAACSSTMQNNVTFYTVQCDPSGGILDLTLGLISTSAVLTRLQAAVYGPFANACPTLSTSTPVECIDIANPTTATPATTFSIPGAPASGVYIVAVSTTGGSATFALGGTNTALPVELLAFTGVINGKVNDLKWSTATERNVAKFIVERSTNGTDFAEIGKVAPTNTTLQHAYSYTDNNPSTRAYYRLRMLDNDGTYKFSNIVELVRRSGSFNVANVYPNPTHSGVFVEYEVEAASTVNFTVTNALGQVVGTLKVEAGKGFNTQPIDLGDFAAGVYLIQIDKNGSERIVRKVVKN